MKKFSLLLFIVIICSIPNVFAQNDSTKLENLECNEIQNFDCCCVIKTGTDSEKTTENKPLFDFLNNFAYPGILIVVGGIITGILIPKYTEKQKIREKEKISFQFKIDLKKELVNTFQDFINASYVIPGNFLGKVFIHYSENIEMDEEDDVSTQRSTFNFPDKIEEQPKAIFQREYLELLEKKIEIKSKYRIELRTKILWYIENHSLINEKINQINKLANVYHHHITNMIVSTSSKEFVSNNNKATKAQIELRSKIETFSKILSEVKIKHIKV